MARGKDPSELAQVRRIRELQKLAAEARAQRAACRLGESNRECAAREEKRDGAAQQWQASIDGESFSPEIAGLWSWALQREEALVRQSSRRKDEAARDVETSARALTAAIERRDLAQDMAAKAARRSVRLKDEQRVEEALERHVQRRDTSS
jgi:hypothetical protein